MKISTPCSWSVENYPLLAGMTWHWCPANSLTDWKRSASSPAGRQTKIKHPSRPAPNWLDGSWFLPRRPRRVQSTPQSAPALSRTLQGSSLSDRPSFLSRDLEAHQASKRARRRGIRHAEIVGNGAIGTGRRMPDCRFRPRGCHGLRPQVGHGISNDDLDRQVPV